jgi:predicted DNA-binding transcriptional regulator AlpA
MNAQVRHTNFPQLTLPSLRFDIPEAAKILRMSRAQLYIRIQEGSITPQKDGARTYIARSELERYVEACAARSAS